MHKIKSTSGSHLWKLPSNLWSPFFLEVFAWVSFSSIFTGILLYFMRQKKERRAPEHNRDAPMGRSAWTCRPAADTQSVKRTAVN